MPDLTMPKVSKGIRPTADERQSAWVVFPHVQGQYLLPIVQKSRKIVPQFHADGSISIETQEPDVELGKLVDEFILTMAAMKPPAISLSTEVLTHFFRLVKALIVKNYDFTDDTINQMICMNQYQLGNFVQIIFFHCLG